MVLTTTVSHQMCNGHRIFIRVWIVLTFSSVLIPIMEVGYSLHLSVPQQVTSRLPNDIIYEILYCPFILILV